MARRGGRGVRRVWPSTRCRCPDRSRPAWSAGGSGPSSPAVKKSRVVIACSVSTATTKTATSHGTASLRRMKKKEIRLLNKTTAVEKSAPVNTAVSRTGLGKGVRAVPVNNESIGAQKLHKNSKEASPPGRPRRRDRRPSRPDASSRVDCGRRASWSALSAAQGAWPGRGAWPAPETRLPSTGTPRFRRARSSCTVGILPKDEVPARSARPLHFTELKIGN